MKLITTQDYDGIPEGTVFEGERVAGPNNEVFWVGIVAIMACSFQATLPDSVVEVWVAEKHDLFTKLGLR